MSSLFYEPFYEFERLIGDSLSNRLLPADTGSQQVQRVGGGDTGRALRPRMDLHEDVQKNVVTATFELPGLKKEDVNIDIHNNRLTVTGESKMSQDYDERGWAICERRYGKFSRTLQLPQGVKDDEIKAKMDNGVLMVTFPKASAEDAPKKITVN